VEGIKLCRKYRVFEQKFKNTLILEKVVKIAGALPVYWRSQKF